MSRRPAGGRRGIAAALLAGAGLAPWGLGPAGGPPRAAAQEIGEEPASIAAHLTGVQPVDTTLLSTVCLDLPREPAFVPAGERRDEPIGERRDEPVGERMDERGEVEPGIRGERRCEVTGTGHLGTAHGRAWRWASYRHVSGFGAAADTIPSDVAPDAPAPPGPPPGAYDTVREEEIVLLTAPSPEAPRARPVWHVRVDERFRSLEPPPRLALHGGGPLVRVRECLMGTGGCRDRVYRLGPEGRMTALRPEYLESLRAHLPEGWGIWKGVFVDVDSLTAWAPVYMPGDPNCCASHRARLALHAAGGALALDGLRIEPDTTNREAWEVRTDGVGPLDSRTGEAELASIFGAGQVRSGEVRLADGRCAPGTVVFPEDPRELRVAWRDTARSGPALIRISRPGSPWRPADGVSIGASPEALERAGEGERTGGEEEEGEGDPGEGEVRLGLAPGPEGVREVREIVVVWAPAALAGECSGSGTIPSPQDTWPTKRVGPAGAQSGDPVPSKAHSSDGSRPEVVRSRREGRPNVGTNGVQSQAKRVRPAPESTKEREER